MSDERRSCLYLGRLTHVRLRPVRHRLSYTLVSVCLDLDELPALDRALRLFSHDRRNLFDFADRDHGDGSGRPLRAWVEATLAAHGASEPPERISVLCLPSMLGRVFNPISVYLCRDQRGAVSAVLYEVNNTFGERYTYVFAGAALGGSEPGGKAARTAAGSVAPLRHDCAKSFHVSPFLAVTGRYRFTLRPPAERYALSITHSDDDGPLLHAVHRAVRAPLTDASLLRCALRQPFLTGKVLGGIHWEALRLWAKGVPTVRRPRQPPQGGAAPKVRQA